MKTLGAIKKLKSYSGAVLGRHSIHIAQKADKLSKIFTNHTNEIHAVIDVLFDNNIWFNLGCLNCIRYNHLNSTFGKRKLDMRIITNFQLFVIESLVNEVLAVSTSQLNLLNFTTHNNKTLEKLLWLPGRIIDGWEKNYTNEGYNLEAQLGKSQCEFLKE